MVVSSFIKSSSVGHSVGHFEIEFWAKGLGRKIGFSAK